MLMRPSASGFSAGHTNKVVHTPQPTQPPAGSRVMVPVGQTSAHKRQPVQVLALTLMTALEVLVRLRLGHISTQRPQSAH